MRKSIPAAVTACGGILAVAATLGAPEAAAVEPTLSWGTSFGGTSINHFTTVPSGAVFDGDIATLNPAIQPGVLGLLADATPFDNTCATAQLVFYPKSGAPETIPVGTACGAPFPYLIVARRPAGEYAEMCGVVTVVEQRTETCFRFPND
ncbi:hypothetical protein [Nocardia sp. NPDC127526]|uniref:hypothetical protein n=1 Tax=Nocardia sp. NPDC127526 TaxID=3345393 RepID=UPI003632BDB8